MYLLVCLYVFLCSYLRLFVRGVYVLSVSTSGPTIRIQVPAREYYTWSDTFVIRYIRHLMHSSSDAFVHQYTCTISIWFGIFRVLDTYVHVVLYCTWHICASGYCSTKRKQMHTCGKLLAEAEQMFGRALLPERRNLFSPESVLVLRVLVTVNIRIPKCADIILNVCYLRVS